MYYAWLLLIVVPVILLARLGLRKWVEWAKRRFEKEKQALIERLRADGRYISWPQLEPRLETGAGTLIYEIRDPHMLHILWWTEDDIASLAPCRIPKISESHWIWSAEAREFIAQIVHDYIDVDSGTANATSFCPERLCPETHLPISRYTIGATKVFLLRCGRHGPWMCHGHFFGSTRQES